MEPKENEVVMVVTILVATPNPPIPTRPTQWGLRHFMMQGDPEKALSLSALPDRDKTPF